MSYLIFYVQPTTSSLIIVIYYFSKHDYFECVAETKLLQQPIESITRSENKQEPAY